MDDFEYSVHISEQDWDTFFQECEECNLLPPVLAGMEDSGMSDMDDTASHRALMGPESTVPEPELLCDSPGHESPVDLYLSRYGMSSPMQVLSGSEDDLHMEAVNVFFERLKSVSAGENPLMPKQKSSELTIHLDGSVKTRGTKEITVPVEIIQPMGSQEAQRNESIQKGDSCKHKENHLEVRRDTSICPNIKPVIQEVPWSMSKMVEVTKQEFEGKCAGPCKGVRLKSDIEKIPCCAPVIAKDLAGPNQEKKEDSHVCTISNSELLVSQGQTSSNTPRRKRRKKKRTSTESLEPDHGHEVQFKAKQSESDDDIFVQRVASSTQSLSLPKIEGILKSFPISQTLTEASLHLTRTHQESLKSPNISTQYRINFVHDTDLTRESASTEQFLPTVNLTSTEIDVPVKKTGPLIHQSVDSTSAASNGDNMRCDLQLYSQSTSDIKASESLPSSIPTSGEVKVISQTTGKHERTESPQLLYSREMNEDGKHHSGISLLQSDPVFCSLEPDSQAGVIADCHPEKEQNSTCVTHEKVPKAHVDGCLSKKNLSETHDPKLAMQSYPVNIETVQTLHDTLMNVQNPQMQATQNSSADTSMEDFTTATQPDVKNELSEKAVISNESVNSTLPWHLQSDNWREEISPIFTSRDVTNLPGNMEDVDLQEVKTEAESRTQVQPIIEQTRKNEPLMQVTGPDSQFKEIPEQSASTASGNEEKSEGLYAPHCSSKDHELSPSAIMMKSINREEYISSDIIISTNEDKGKAQHLSQSPDAISQDIASPTLETVDGEEHIPSKIINTGDKEKSKVHIEPGQLPKDHSLLSTEITQGVASPTTEIIDKAPSNVITLVEEEKGKVQYVPHCPSKDDKLSPTAMMQGISSPITVSMDRSISMEANNGKLSLLLQSEDWTKEISPSIKSNDIPSVLENENGMNVKAEEIPLPVIEDNNDGQSFKDKTSTCQTLRGPEMSQPEEPLNSRHISSNICTTAEKQNSEVPHHCLPNDHEIPPIAKIQCSASPTPETGDGEDWLKEISPFIQSNIIPSELDNKNGINVKTVEILLPVTEDSNEGQSFKDKTSTCHPLRGPEMSQPEELSNSDSISPNYTTGEEENSDVPLYGVVPPHCPPNDHEIPPTATTQCTASSPETGNGEDWTKEISPSMNSNIIPSELDNKNGINVKTVEILLPVTEDSNEGQSFKEQIRTCHPLRGPEMSQPEKPSNSEHILSNICATGEDEGSEVPHHCPPNEYEASSIAVIQSMPSPASETMDGVENDLSNVLHTGNEEKGTLHNKPSLCQPKDIELSSNELMLDMAFCTAESMDRAEHVSSNIIRPVDEEKLHDGPLHCATEDHKLSPSASMKGIYSTLEPMEIKSTRLPLHSQSEEWTEDMFPSLRSNDISGYKQSCPGQCFKEHTLKCQPLIQVTGLESQLLEDLKSEYIPSNIFITGDKEKGEVHNEPPKELLPSAMIQSSTYQTIDEIENNPSNIITIVDEEKDKVYNVPQQLPSRDLELSASEMLDGTASLPESMDRAKSVEIVSQPIHPVYAISSFWNEMEKLTINDILRLRLVDQSQHPSVLLQPEDSGIVDISDAADSGYFTHLDDSKPDRSSGDMSFISDFEEELAQLQSQDAAKVDEASRESPNSADVMWGGDPYPTGMGSRMEDVLMLSSETALPPPVCRDNAEQCFRKMCKNISVQNLQALEAQPLKKMLRNASLLSIHSVHSTHSFQVEDDYVDPFDRVDPLSPASLSDDEEEVESSGVTFSEIIQYLFGSDEPEHSTSAADNVTASYLDGTGTSVPEIYDHFFSEFESGNFFTLLPDDSGSGKDEIMPIFSCSRSTSKNLQFPEAYDYFFPDDSPVHSDEDEEHDHTAIWAVTRNDDTEAKSDNIVAEMDSYEEISPETNYSWNFLRMNPFSFRKVRRTGFTTPPEKSSSWALTPVKKSGRSIQRGIQPINAMGPDESPFPDPLLYSLENRIFMQLADPQKIRNEMQTAVADPRLDAPLMPLKQADMCLVCIAFASWVLKSANPQGADMWKAALLANISALSAIRYLRRYMRDEAAKKTPLRQIEPA